MKRPIISEFLGDGIQIADVQKMYLDCIELYNYMQALDTYIDYMEENFIPNEPKTISNNECESKFCKCSIPNLSMIDTNNEGYCIKCDKPWKAK